MVLLCATGPGTLARAGAPGGIPDPSGLGIQLLEAPASRRDDPRALRYIVDHLAPGSTIKRKIKVVNHSTEHSRVELYAAGADIAENQFQFADGRTANELTEWISLSKDRVTLDPKESVELTATVQVPPKASAGEQYAVIWAATVPAGKPRTNVTIVRRVGIRVYLDVGPGGEPRSDFAIGEVVPARDPAGQPSVTVTVRNTGGRALDMGGSATLSDGPGGVRAGPFDVVEGTTLPVGGTGVVRMLFPAELSNGPWRITLDLVSGKVKQSATGTITFPDPGGTGRRTLLDRLDQDRWLWASALAAVVIALCCVVLLVRRRRRRAVEAAVPTVGARTGR